MKKLIITHGSFATGIKGALEVIMGPNDELTTIDAFVDDRSLAQLITPYLETLDLTQEKLLVFTDLPGGSVNQYFLSEVLNENVFIVSGINLPLILELSLMPEELLTEETIENAVNMAREQLVYFSSHTVQQASTEDDFDF